MGDLEQLNLAKISELTTGDASHFKEEVEELDLTLKDLRSLKEAEEAGKNRNELVDFLDRQINTENAAAYLGIAENDIGELNDILDEIERIEDVEHFDEENIDINQDNLIDLVGGTVNEMKDFVKDNPLSATQLENILEAEKRVKNRKTAKKYLNKQLRKNRAKEDVSAARDDLKDLKDDIEQLKSDEAIATDIAEGSNDTSEEESEEDEEESEKENEDEESNDDEDSSEESEENEESEQDKESEEDEESDEDETSDDLTDFEKKKEIAEELELDMSDEELENFSLSDLENIKSEKAHREELINRLKDEGLDEEDLRNSSTGDLEKVVESMDQKDESQEEHEEMREEAEEDLEMLMGAVRWDQEDDEDTGKNTKEKLQDLKQNIRDTLNRSSSKEEQSTGINADKVQEVLDQYRNLGDEEASIKTAHIMKGFLEQSLEIKREMTYKELAETMPTDDESMEDLADFFLKMNREQYTGRFEVEDSDSIIDTCEDVIERMN